MLKKIGFANLDVCKKQVEFKEKLQNGREYSGLAIFEDYEGIWSVHIHAEDGDLGKVSIKLLRRDINVPLLSVGASFSLVLNKSVLARGVVLS